MMWDKFMFTTCCVIRVLIHPPVLAIIISLIALLMLLSGCHGVSAPTITAPAGSTPASVAKALISITSIPYLGVLAMSGAVFIAFIGNPKLGMAVGAAGGAALALSLAVIKYAWVLGLLSAVAMVGAGVFAVLANRKFKRQMVLGVQNVKAVLSSRNNLEDDPKQIPSDISELMTSVQTPDVTAQVLKIKKRLPDAAHTE